MQVLTHAGSAFCAEARWATRATVRKPNLIVEVNMSVVKEEKMATKRLRRKGGKEDKKIKIKKTRRETKV